jgi:hypothetical protein
MRQILIDHARKRHAGKGGGGVPQISLDRALDIAEAQPADLLVLGEALARLQRMDDREYRRKTRKPQRGLNSKRLSATWSQPGAGKWQREQTAAEPLRGRTATSILFLSALKWACW